MRILYLCQDHGVSVFGRKGCSTHVRETCRALKEAGHQVTVLCSFKGDDQGLACDLDVREASPGHLRKIGYDGRNLWHNLAFYREACNIARKQKIEAIYERFSLYGFAGTWLGNRKGLPRIVEVNAFLTVEHQSKIYFPKLAAKSEAYIARRAPALAVVSQPLVDSLVELGVSADRIFIMPMAVDTSHFLPDPSRGGAIREKWNLNGKHVIGYIGSLSGWHGINLLHDIAESIASMRKDFVILAVGGEEKHIERHRAKARERGVEAHLIFAGSVPYTEVPHHINAMDMALVPDTNYWTCPTKMYEYQASGIPTIAPRYPAILRSMDDGQEGVLFEPRNIPQMVQRILYLMDHPAARRSMGAKARQRVEATHSWQHNIARINRLFEAMQAGEMPLRGPLGAAISGA